MPTIRENSLLKLQYGYSIMNLIIEQRHLGCNGRFVRPWGYIREWGQEFSKSPHLTNTVGIEITYPLAKASHWGNLRRQDSLLLEMRVGRPAGIDRIVAKNGYGDVLPGF